MIWQWLLPGLVGALVVLTGLLVVALLRGRSRARAELALARAETERLRQRVEGIEHKLSVTPAAPEASGFVITDVGGYALPSDGVDARVHDSLPAVPARIEGRLFADLVLRDTVVKVAGLAHGVRRALAPENRFRMRYEFGREVKRSRRARRAELREARRHLQSLRRPRSEDAA